MTGTDDLIPENLKQSPSSSKISSTTSRCIGDYKILKEIGEGAFSVVYVATERCPPCREVAVKMCVKQQIIKQKRVENVHREKDILIRLSKEENSHPFITTLYASFQDIDNLYFVITYAKYGDLLNVMLKKSEKRFELQDAVFYSSEILAALQHLHKLSIVHRDLKPENVLVAGSGHILLSDFGVAKDFTAPVKDRQETRGRRSSFVGTAQYVSPEILDGKKQTTATDLWSFGALLFQLLAGRNCFHDETEYLIFQRIQKLLYSFPELFPSHAQDLIERLLVIDPSQRLGTEDNGGPEGLRSHPFFETVDWEHIETTIPPSVDI